ncbi:hypothetical protein BGW37DRAFT_493259 [Umbelopsis sp. PMI_123]|nr:hypothetical protein BGW37DRAFT_493259 [Umbelopsis sp. PMI_123]
MAICQFLKLTSSATSFSFTLLPVISFSHFPFCLPLSLFSSLTYRSFATHQYFTVDPKIFCEKSHSVHRMQSVRLIHLLFSVLLLFTLDVKMTKYIKKPKVQHKIQFTLAVRSSPIDIPIERTDVEPSTLLDSRPRDPIPWPAWLIDKYEEPTMQATEDGSPEDDDSIFMIEDL